MDMILRANMWMTRLYCRSRVKFVGLALALNLLSLYVVFVTPGLIWHWGVRLHILAIIGAFLATAGNFWQYYTTEKILGREYLLYTAGEPDHLLG